MTDKEKRDSYMSYIADLGLSFRTYNCLKRAEIPNGFFEEKNKADAILRAFNSESIKMCPGFGKKSLQELLFKLDGLSSDPVKIIKNQVDLLTQCKPKFEKSSNGSQCSFCGVCGSRLKQYEQNYCCGCGTKIEW